MSAFYKDEMYYELRERALKYLRTDNGVQVRWGVPKAVMTFFEARLYVSCRRRKGGSYELTKEEQELFTLSEYYSAHTHLSGYEGGRIFWDKTNLLILAYQHGIQENLGAGVKAPSHKIGKLLAEFCNNCGTKQL